MHFRHTLKFALVDRERLNDSIVGGESLSKDPLADVWSADASPEAAEAVQASNEAKAARLHERLPQLEVIKQNFGLVSHFVEAAGLDEDAAWRRYHRYIALAGPWREGRLGVELLDGITVVSAEAVDLAGAADRRAFEQELAALIAGLCEASGQVFYDAVRTTLPADEAARTLLARNADGLKQLEGATRRGRWGSRFGGVSVVVLALLALLASAAIVRYAVERGTLLTDVDVSRPMTFVTDYLPQPDTLWHGLAPDYELAGHIAETGELARVEAFRNHYIAAGPGARFPVYATRRAAMPYVLRDYYANTQPVARLGETGVSWSALLALIPVFLWGFFVGRPYSRTTPAERPLLYARLGPTLVGLLKFALIIAAVVAMKVKLLH